MQTIFFTINANGESKTHSAEVPTSFFKMSKTEQNLYLLAKAGYNVGKLKPASEVHALAA